MKKFIEEFKTFITRGNVIDLAVGVIIGGAFTAIVTALTTNILTPFINFILYLVFGKEGSLDGVYTVLVGTYLDSGALDTANSIYIDWGAFVSAIINFFLIALVLFIIIKAINKIQAENDKFKKDMKKNYLSKEDRKILKQRKINLLDRQKVKEYLAEKEAEELQKAEMEKAEKEEKERQDRLNNPTELDILKDIKTLLEKNNK